MIVNADKYNIDIEKMDEDTYRLKFRYYFDKNNKEQRVIFEDNIPYLEAQSQTLNSIPFVTSSLNIDKENLTLELELTSNLKLISDTIVGEFINYSSLGSVTLSQLIELISKMASVMSNQKLDDKDYKSCKG